VALYRILQEALTNIMRHAEATEACIQVEEYDHQVILTVSDNGRYIDDMPLTPGYGLKGIRERSQALGGECRIGQKNPHGLSLEVRLPISPRHAAPSLSPADGRQNYG
jgi:signal transduction histidine kinase